MTTKAKTTLSGFTLIEAMAVALVLGVLLLIFALPGPRALPKASRIRCVNNLKEIGTAYRLWANDHGDRVPSLQGVTSNGWADFLTNGNQGALCWTNYMIVREELGQSTKVLICPADERKPADGFSNHFGNLNVSYFVGVGADDTYPQSITGGDRNLGYGPGSYRDYGYSPLDGSGNDVAVELSSSNHSVSWSLKMHSAGNTAGAGNILLADGSSQQCSSSAFRVTWLRNAEDQGNWPKGKTPAVPAIRLVFP